MNTFMKVVVGVLLAVVLLAGGFLGGFAVAKVGQTAPGVSALAVDTGGLGDQVEEVQRLLADKALEPSSDTSATAGAIQGLLEANGDKYGLYFDPKHFEYFNEESMGAFGGIGVVLGEKDGTAYVVEVYEDTPAEKAGVKAGDVFVKIGKVGREKWTSEEVVKRVRGEEGTPVTITFLRPGKDGAEGKEYTVDIVRATIEIPNIMAEKKGDVGYIRVGQFNQQVGADLAEEIRKLEEKGAKSLVIDLRDNPGGLLDQAVDVVSLFVDNGVVVKIEERTGEPQELRATGNKVTDAPLVVLVNENSASASEIVAGALQDYGRAEVVGAKTFGKGSVQTVEELSFGGAIKFTTAHYLTPKGRVINGKGVEPDVVVKMEADKQVDEKTDLQLKRALEIAKKRQAK